MTEKVMRHKELCDGLNTLYARKNHDYGDSAQQQVTDESIRDTLLDLANYAIMTVLELDQAEAERADPYSGED